MVAHLCSWHTSRFCLLLQLGLLLCLAGASSKVQELCSAFSPRNSTTYLGKALPTAHNAKSKPELEHINEPDNVTISITTLWKSSVKERMLGESTYRKLLRRPKRMYWGGYVPIRASDFANDVDLPSNESVDVPSFATASPALPLPSSSSFSSPSLEASSVLPVVKASDRYWCIARPWANVNVLQAALDWACGVGGSDCTWIQLSNPCYVPNTLISHASFAFNSYFQIHQQATGTCDFAGTAMITNEDPSYPGCNYPFRQGQVGAPIIGNGDSREGIARAAILYRVMMVSLLLLLCC
ncbi:hypothetical protein L7F22_036223 [Adiantum nelumboides]|nr:hypothetical protein [Adiantum nelumboides]